VDPATGFTGVDPSHYESFEAVACPMNVGDVLCFHQVTPHRALPNLSQKVRWSLDVRFEAADAPTETGRKMGFPLAKAGETASVVSYEEWLERWRDMPRGSY
jgi:phytanoyl-CoA hydroxylase